VQVPDLQGKSVAEASAVLTGAGLILRVEEPRRPDRVIPADHILSQEPQAGAVLRRQRSVRVRVSDGARDPVVPVLTDLPERTAEVTLAAVQVAVGTRAEIRSIAYRPGVVVAQDPEGGGRSATANLLINRGDSAVSYVVPDLIGTLGVRAVEALRTMNFRVAVTAEVAYPGLPSGVVVRQLPLPGFRLRPHESIALEVTR
jgi:serine/threonine-protein kinase